MKRWNFLALVLVLLPGPVALAQATTGSQGAAADAESSARALAVYEEGKRLYDAKKYKGALEKFDQAAALEPRKARWQYNRGLALRKLNRYPEAREALLQSRALDPAYKRAEIDDKLREMGFSTEETSVTPPAAPVEEPAPSTGAATGSDTAPAPAPSTGAATGSDTTSEPASGTRSPAPRNTIAYRIGQVLGVLLCFGGPLLLLVGLIRWIRRLIRKPKEPADEWTARGEAEPSSRDVDLSPLDQRLEQVSGSLVSVEHALRLEEDADLRALLNQATMAEQRARDELEQARRGQTRPVKAATSVGTAEDSANAAMERAKALFGDKAFLPEGERVGCYFCARPLANPSFRRQVPLKRGSEVTPVVACPPCANMASAGQSPPVKVRVAQGRTMHWSELGGYDPYTHRHKSYPGTSMVPAWDYTPERSLGEVAAMAAGGALAGGLAAYAVSELLDLDGAREAAAAQAATQAAAMRASEHREERDWRDHS